MTGSKVQFQAFKNLPVSCKFRVNGCTDHGFAVRGRVSPLPGSVAGGFGEGFGFGAVSAGSVFGFVLAGGSWSLSFGVSAVAVFVSVLVFAGVSAITSRVVSAFFVSFFSSVRVFF